MMSNFAWLIPKSYWHCLMLEYQKSDLVILLQKLKVHLFTLLAKDLHVAPGPIAGALSDHEFIHYKFPGRKPLLLYSNLWGDLLSFLMNLQRSFRTCD